MRVVIHVPSDTQPERKLWLRDNQSLRIGSSAWADYCAPWDDQIAPLHFEIRTTNGVCQLQSLDPAAGVWLNGQPVAGAVPLAHGDAIGAGQSWFTVEILGGLDQSPPVGSIPGSGSPGVALPPGFYYRSVSCGSAWPSYAGDAEHASVIDVARFLEARVPLHLVVNFGQARLPVPAGLDAAADLLARPDLPQARRRLMRISPGDPPDRLALWENLLGKDAVCGVFSPRGTDELTATLRSAAISYSAPSILAGQLSSCPAGFVQRVLPGLTAVLVETITPAGWRLFANPAFAATWKELGLPRPPADESDGPAGETKT